VAGNNQESPVYLSRIEFETGFEELNRTQARLDNCDWNLKD
jgi:hypothetical protein